MLISGSLTGHEARALRLATEHMRQLFVQAGSIEWKIDCRLLDDPADREDRSEIFVLSMLKELDASRGSIADVRRRLADTIAELKSEGSAVFLCTIFRACEHDPPTIERIRRLNLLAIELSHDLDAGLIDIDRMLADIGARQLQTSYNLEGQPACDVAAYTIVKTLLAGGAFDETLPSETVERARALYDRAYDGKLLRT